MGLIEDDQYLPVIHLSVLARGLPIDTASIREQNLQSHPWFETGRRDSAHRRCDVAVWMSTGYLEARVVHMSHDRERIGCRVSTRDLGDNVAKLVLLESDPAIS